MTSCLFSTQIWDDSRWHLLGPSSSPLCRVTVTSDNKLLIQHQTNQRWKALFVSAQVITAALLPVWLASSNIPQSHQTTRSPAVSSFSGHKYWPNMFKYSKPLQQQQKMLRNFRKEEALLMVKHKYLMSIWAARVQVLSRLSRCPNWSHHFAV